MSININNKKYKPFINGVEVEVWIGTKKIYPDVIKMDSYLILTDDTRIDFNSNNTPITNFETTDTSLTINGQDIDRKKIKEVHFTDDYSNVTSIGYNFLGSCSSLTSIDLSPLSNVTSIGNYVLSGCSSLTSIDLSGLSNITSIGNYFLRGCTSLTSIDLSGLSNITSIGNYFLRGCTSLTTLKMGAETPPTLGSSAFNSSNNLSLISVPCASESAYKSATNWIDKADIIQGDC